MKLKRGDQVECHQCVFNSKFFSVESKYPKDSNGRPTFSRNPESYGLNDLKLGIT